MLDNDKNSGLPKGCTSDICNALDSMIMVTDPETDIVLYANEKMNKSYGVTDDPVGKRCYEIYQKNQNQRCDFCPVPQLLKNPGAPVGWETFNTSSQ